MGWRAIKEEDSNFVEIADYLDNNLFDYRAFISFPFDCDEDKEIVREEFRKRGWSFTEGAQAYKTCVHLEELVGSILFIRDFRKFFKSIQYSRNY